MARVLTPAFLAALALSVCGCGGSSSSVSSSSGGGTSASPQYSATLPDGSTMDLEVMDASGGIMSGTFAVVATTGPDAFQSGEFMGTITGDTINITCDTGDGTEFTMTGKKSGNGYQLTRSDIPGAVLSFTFEAPDSNFRAAADVSFLVTTGGTNGRATISTTPYSVQGNGQLTEYRGTWQGTPCTFWSYNSGQANLVLYVDPLAIDSVNFSNYRISDIPTATVTGPNGIVTVYSNVTKGTFKFKNSVTCSP